MWEASPTPKEHTFAALSASETPPTNAFNEATFVQLSISHTATPFSSCQRRVVIQVARFGRSQSSEVAENLQPRLLTFFWMELRGE